MQTPAVGFMVPGHAEEQHENIRFLMYQRIEGAESSARPPSPRQLHIYNGTKTVERVQGACLKGKPPANIPEPLHQPLCKPAGNRFSNN